MLKFLAVTATNLDTVTRRYNASRSAYHTSGLLETPQRQAFRKVPPPPLTMRLQNFI